MVSPRPTGPTKKISSVFTDIPGWAEADHAAALGSYLLGKDGLKTILSPRQFFETGFEPEVIDDVHFTGYFEPEFDASLEKTGTFQHPIFRTPPDLPDDTPWHARAAIEQGLLDGRGLEIAWLSDPFDVFFLQVQGSGRLRLPDGRTLRVGFAARNGHPYRSIGKLLVEQGDVPASEISMQAIRRWGKENPDQITDLLRQNPSFVFFKELPRLYASDGPITTLGVPATPLGTLAVDPDHIPLGTPVWVETPAHSGMTIAQDTGSAITGRNRADLFIGSGASAGEIAGRLNARGRMIVFWPSGEKAHP